MLTKYGELRRRFTQTRRLFDILDSDAASLPQALSRLLDSAQEAWIVFELIIEPVVLGREAYQHAGRLSAAGNDNLLSFGFVQKSGEIVLDFG